MSEWIDVNDRLPEDGQMVFVQKYNGMYGSLSVAKFKKNTEDWLPLGGTGPEYRILIVGDKWEIKCSCNFWCAIETPVIFPEEYKTVKYWMPIPKIPEQNKQEPQE